MKSTDSTRKGYNEKTPDQPQGANLPDNGHQDNDPAKKPKTDKAPVAEKKLKAKK